MFNPRFLIFLLAFGAAIESPAIPWVDPAKQFTIDLPERAIQFDTGRSDAPLALRFSEAGIPNFNVVVSPGAYELIGRAPGLQAERVLESYRRLGLTSSRVIEGTERTSACGAVFEAVLEYDLNDVSYRTWIRIVSGLDRNFNLTFLDRSGADSLPEVRRRLFESFCPLQTQPVSPGSKASASLWFGVVGAILALAAVLAFSWCRLRPRV